MIVIEKVQIRGREFTRTYSDEHRYVVRSGKVYEEAYDPADMERTYAEGDEIPVEAGTEDKAEAYDILMGVET